MFNSFTTSCCISVAFSLIFTSCLSKDFNLSSTTSFFEVKSFISPSPIKDLEVALGQYQLYKSVLIRRDPERQLYLAMPETFYQTVMQEQIGQFLLDDYNMNLLIFNSDTGDITLWHPDPETN